MEYPYPRDGRGHWNPYPPATPGIYLYCAHQGAPVTRLLVEPWYGKLAARPLEGDKPIPVRRMIGWWYLEDAVTPEKQIMEGEGEDAELIELEWLT